MNRKKTRAFRWGFGSSGEAHAAAAIGRRMFLDRAARLAVGGVTVATLLDALNPATAGAQELPAQDTGLLAEYVQFPSPQGHGKIRGYLARPHNTTALTFRAPAGLTGRRRPGVLVLHENRGLSGHIETVARHLARENFVAFAPDALSPFGGYIGNEEKAADLFDGLDQAKIHEDFVAAADYLKRHPACSGRIAVIGFGYGGRIATMLAARVPNLAAAVSFYSTQPGAEEVARMKAPLLLHYADEDKGVNAGIPAFEAALKANGVIHAIYRYSGTEHGFYNDTTPQYQEAAAKLAWTRTVEFLRRALRG